MLFESDFFLRQKKIAAGNYDFRAHVEQVLNRIEEKKELNAFITTFREDALANAVTIQNQIAAGTAGKLAGMVIAVKDVLSMEGKPLSCASKILNGFHSVYTATAVQKLVNESALIIGKTNCDEFAMGSSNENSAFGAVRNPVNPGFVPGGSSGGSAAAVAAGLCDAALGTDTGGSIRQPAAFCGIYGLKPTYSRVSRYGLTAFASSFDTIGPFANDVRTIALLLQVIAGYDEKDETSSLQPVDDYPALAAEDATPLKIGVPKEYLTDGIQPRIRSALEAAVEQLRSKGIECNTVSLPFSMYAISTYYILITAEASSNLARYDGAHYGSRAPHISNLSDMYVRSRSDGFGKEVKRRIMLGTHVLSSGYYDAYYRKAQQVRRLIKEDFTSVFNQVDVLLMPTTPTTAFKIGEKITDPLAMYLGDIFTISANLAGIPGLSIPYGTDENGLPIGLQLIGREFEEGNLLRLASLSRIRD